jgi:hypothetical protein
MVQFDSWSNLLGVIDARVVERYSQTFVAKDYFDRLPDRYRIDTECMHLLLYIETFHTTFI